MNSDRSLFSTTLHTSVDSQRIYYFQLIVMGKVRRTREKSYVSQAVPNNPDVDPHPLTKKDKRKLKHEQLIKSRHIILKIIMMS